MLPDWTYIFIAMFAMFAFMLFISTSVRNSVCPSTYVFGWSW